MPIKSKRELFCERCGKKFILECNDNITIEDLKKLNNKLDKGKIEWQKNWNMVKCYRY
jgi:hypothetical protein